MNILAFDTSSSACSVALLNTELHRVAPMQQGHLILPMIQEILTQNNLKLAELDAIAYGAGPGSFTGLRIAASVAQALSLPTQTPLIPISSLAIMAATVLLENTYDYALIALDARMDQLYIGVYKLNSDKSLTLVTPEFLFTPGDSNSLETLKNALKNINNWCGAGDGWVKYSNDLINCVESQPAIVIPDVLPHAKVMLSMAEDKLNKGEWVKAANALPHYLR